MFMLFRWRTANHLATCFVAVAGAVGCGDSEGPPLAPPEVPIPDSGYVPPQADAGFMQPVGSACQEAEIKTCKVLLPAHGSIHPCFVGVQICRDGKWSGCIEPPGDAGPAGDGSTVK